MRNIGLPYLRAFKFLHFFVTLLGYSYFDTAKRTVSGKTIERNIQWYRMWFTYLKLCIEPKAYKEKSAKKKVTEIEKLREKLKLKD